MTRPRSSAALAAFAAATGLVYVVGGLVTASSVGGWYQLLAKPPFNPPDWVFAPVWSALYVAMAIGGYLAWNGARDRDRRLAVGAYAVQLGLNLLWTLLFFGLNWIAAALAEILLLWAAVIGTMVLFWRIDRRAGWLFLPYAAWVGFAIALNAGIWWLN